MRLLLRQAVDALGEPGDEVNVRAGYARNYLLPRRIAVPVTEENRREVADARQAWAVQKVKDLEAARALAGMLADRTLGFERRVKTDSDELYGSVSVQDIGRELADAGFEIQRNRIILGSPIKKTGASEVVVRLHPDVEVKLAIEVTAAAAASLGVDRDAVVPKEAPTSRWSGRGREKRVRRRPASRRPARSGGLNPLRQEFAWPAGTPSAAAACACRARAGGRARQRHVAFAEGRIGGSRDGAGRRGGASRTTPPPERAVLAAVLVDRGQLDGVREVLKPKDFLDVRHQRIFETLCALDDAPDGRKIDLVTVRAQLERSGQLAAAGGGAYLSELFDGVAVSSNAADYARLVHDRSLGRQLKRFGSRVAHEAAHGAPEEIIASAEKDLFAIAEGSFASGPVRITEEIDRIVAESDQPRKDYSGIRTDLHDLDELMGGLRKSDLVLVGARPGEGKTSLALNIALAAGRARKVVLIFSLEMPLRQIAIRLLFSQARVDARQLSRPGMLSDRDRKLLRNALPVLADMAPSCGRLECHAGGTALEGPPAQARARPGPDRGGLSPAHAGGGTGNPALREPESGDRGDQPVSQGAGEGTRCAGAGALPAQPGAREA